MFVGARCSPTAAVYQVAVYPRYKAPTQTKYSSRSEYFQRVLVEGVFILELIEQLESTAVVFGICLLYTSPSPRD